MRYRNDAQSREAIREGLLEIPWPEATGRERFSALKQNSQRILLHARENRYAGQRGFHAGTLSAPAKTAHRKFLHFGRTMFECPAYDETARADFL